MLNLSNAQLTDSRPQSRGGAIAEVLPGVIVAASMASAAFALRLIPGVKTFSPMILAIIIGMAYNNLVGTPAWAKRGVTFSMRRILRLAIVLLGLQLTIAQIIDAGAKGVAVIVISLLATFGITAWMGQRLGVDSKLAQLIAAGTSICGASAVIATNTVTDAPDEDVAYAVACVTVFGSIAMFIYPLLPELLNLNPHDFGLWAGSSIHEIAQVVAAAFQDGQTAGEFATVAKLSRVMLLAPTVIALGLLAARRSQQVADKHNISPKHPAIPGFVLGFIALVILNSCVTIPPSAKAGIITLTTFLLSIALAAMGLETDVRKLAAKGFRPALLGLFAFVFIATFSLGLVKLAG
jgi:uncharacterized integral membrane protein (TIGR00698 family)